MKRLIFLTLALVLAITSAAWAQSPTTSAPTGSSLQREPQPANNDLRNPGNPQDQATGSSSSTSGSSATTTTPPSSSTDNSATGTTGSTTYNSTGSTSSSSTDTTGTTGTSTDTTGGHLPKTGSDMPLVGLIGLIALVSALGLRTYTKRNA